MISLFAAHAFPHQDAAPIVTTCDGAAVWCHLRWHNGIVLFVGTDFAKDLVRYRQGDPLRVTLPDHQKQRWGYADERPNYLFDEQREGEAGHTRHADEWAFFLAYLLAGLCQVDLAPVLPNDARGAIVLTGDSDAVTEEAINEQLQFIDGLPITYFLYPKLDYPPRLIQELKTRDNVDLGIHPDALESPENYDAILKDQINWFTRMVGRPPTSVRNHGFLNQGYWGHLRSWIASDLTVSSNLPGFDGNVINGSLLPARIALEAELTDHWSLLTLIGDGAMFINNLSDVEAENCIYRAAQHVMDSGIPGVIVLNLHPINVRRALPMHKAAKHVIEQGFIPWNLKQCIDWFRETA